MYGVYLECIYDDNSNCILYASQYYITQKMDKIRGKIYKKERRETQNKRSFQKASLLLLKWVFYIRGDLYRKRHHLH